MATPIMVAIGGDSGTGKAALCAGLREIYGEERCAEVHLDGYFALNRVQRNAAGLTPLDPRTHDFAAMDEGLWQLAHGAAVTVPVYDHLMGAVSGSRSVEPREIVLAQGRFPLYTHVLRSLFDVGVWLERAPGVSLPWSIHQDVAGAAGERRRADYETYLMPQAEHADVVLRFTPAGMTLAERGRPAIEVDAAIDAQRAAALETELRGGSHSERPIAGNGSGEHESPLLTLVQLFVARAIDRIAQQRAGAVTAP